jgi:hypothetical protein
MHSVSIFSSSKGRFYADTLHRWLLSSLDPNSTKLAAGAYYDTSKSSTWSYLSPGESFYIVYNDGSGAHGPLVSETVAIGAWTVVQQHMGIANYTNPFPGGPGLIGLCRTQIGWYGGE